MTEQHRTHDPADAADVARFVAGLAELHRGHEPVIGLHAGDIGWALRDADPGELHGWWDGDDLLAAALVEGPVARTQLAPRVLHDRRVAEAVAGLLDELPHDEVWSDVTAGSALDARLRELGWRCDDDPWVSLHRDLGPGVVSDETADEARHCVADRVEVQVNGFDGSTFTEEKWRRMAAGPGYSPSLDLVVRDGDGTPVAAATAWLSVPGGVAIMEPVATHRDHRRRGHGRRVIVAVTEAARRLGATGVSVATPARNEQAVAAYTRSGWRTVTVEEALTRRRG